MFDPTIFDNLKVVLEGLVYDHDLAGRIMITDRSDWIDLAKLSRSFRIRFRIRTPDDPVQATAEWADAGQKEHDRHFIQAEIVLSAGVKDLAGEIMGLNMGDADRPGCELKIRWITVIQDVEECEPIRRLLMEVWEADHPITQRISYDVHDPARLALTSELDFQRKIDENQIEDLPGLMEHVLRSLFLLQERLA